MNISFGKHAGKSVELLVLRHPDYVHWLLQQKDASGRMKLIQVEARRLITQFNSKPFIKNCFGYTDPLHRATRCTVYGSYVEAPYWWCNSCNPYQSGADPGKLQPVSSYGDALRHVAAYCNGRSTAYKSLIRDLAEAKGLPTRVGEKQAKAFFA